MNRDDLKLFDEYVEMQKDIKDAVEAQLRIGGQEVPKEDLQKASDALRILNEAHAIVHAIFDGKPIAVVTGLRSETYQIGIGVADTVIADGERQ